MDGRMRGSRILIVGSAGAGKSTLARQLGDALGLPVIHLDAHYWRPGWVETPKDEWRQVVAGLLTGERWIIDGNYSGTLDQRIALAHAIIFLDVPPLVCLYRVLKRRWQYRGRSRLDIGAGCIEKIDLEFLKWVLVDFPRRNRRQLLARLQTCPAGMQVITLRSSRAVRALLAAVKEAAHPI